MVSYLILFQGVYKFNIETIPKNNSINIPYSAIISLPSLIETRLKICMDFLAVILTLSSNLSQLLIGSFSRNMALWLYLEITDSFCLNCFQV